MPNRSLRGVVNNPSLVVAPIRVKGCSSILTVLAAGPSPITRSNSKSSKAGYNTSSTAGFSRCTSSIKSTSLGSRLVKMAAKSPAFAKTGPDVMRKLTPNSRLIIWAKVVFPSPGGP